MARGAPAVAPRERDDPLRELRWFIVFAFAGAWIVGGVAYIVLDLGELGLGIGVLMVAIGALVATKRYEGSLRSMVQGIIHWRLGVRWYAVAIGLPFVALAAALLLGPVVGGEGLPADAPAPAFLLMLPLYVLLFGGPEELGWRGYALPRLQARFSALTSTLLLAGIWMAWHVPVLALPSVLFDEVPLLPYLVVGVASSVVYTWLYNSTRGSILIVMVLHGATNLSLAWLGGSVMTYGVFAGAWVIVALVLVAAYGPANLARIPRQQRAASDAQSGVRGSRRGAAVVG